MTWKQTASGRALELLGPIPFDGLDLRRDVAIPLGLAGRFANQMPAGVLYPVAQHCCIGADYIYAATQDVESALAFLLHDGHKAVIGDWTTPTLEAMQAIIDRQVPGSGVSMKAVKRALCAPLDTWLHARAGLAWPLPPHIARTVAITDVRLMLTERNHLLAHPPKRWSADSHQPLKLKHRIVTQTPARATEQWLTRFERWSEAIAARAPRPSLRPAAGVPHATLEA